MIPFFIHTAEKIPKERGRSERIIKKLLERQGWEVWRSASINILQRDELYPNVKNKYKRLHALLQHHHPSVKEELQLLAAVHYGLPDFICFRNEFKFVECKRGYEQLSDIQTVCITKLQQFGFLVELHILGYPATKARTGVLKAGKKEVVEKQLSIQKFTAKVSLR
jgi:hypothetical protein